MKHSSTLTKTFFSTLLSLLSFHAIAAPGTLVDTPLSTGTAAEPNIMFIIDNSGSMEHVVEESFTGDADKYDKSITYINDCSSPTATTNTAYIYFTGGRPYVTLNSTSTSTSYTVDYNTSHNTTGTICFDPTKNYSANLHASNGTRPYGFTALYTGNFLNWYFKYDNTNKGGTVAKNWTSASALADRYKPGTQIRRIIARDSMTSLVTALEVSDLNIRVGLAAFTSGTGAKIFDEINHLDVTQRDNINANIQNLGDGGGTPLAETLHQVGKYFIGENGAANPGNLLFGSTATKNGQYDGNLILHPAAITPTTADDDVVFNNKPRNSSSTRESPIQYWCQNNFAVVMTDGLPTNDQNIPSLLQDYDSDCVSASPACSTYDRKDTSLGYIYESSGSNPSDYLDDVAQAMFETDLRPDINDYAGNPVKNNVITYTIAFADQDALNNKLISDAGIQGGGEAISAADGADLIAKFTEVTNKILATTSSAASVTFNTGTLQSNTSLYQSLFTTSRWSGDILSYPVNPTNGNINFLCTPDVTPGCWSAATHIDKLAYNKGTSTFVNNRQVITYNPISKKGVPFVAPADFTAPLATELSTTILNDLCAGPDVPTVSGVACTSATATDKTNSQNYINQLVDYFRGDRTYEAITNAPTFRTRQSVLGDIIHATPAFVSTPALRWPTLEATTNKFGIPTNRYSDYKTLKASRTKALYALANDGMLHAFRTEDDTLLSTPNNKAGDELFAFMPSFIFSDQTKEGYHYLAQPGYSHKYYLDLSPTFSDIYGKVKDTSQTNFKTATADWHTILIGGSRGGEKKGIFAIDVTDPLTITESNAADKILWEFTSSDDADLGFTYSKPTIAMTNAIDADGLHRWAAIFGNGYQSDGTGTLPTGASCHAVLFVVFLDGGLDGTWTLGTNPSTADYMKIDTKVGTATAGGCNGLSTPALYDTDGDRVLDRVYAGDVQGNMWAFDLTCGGSGGCGSTDFKVAYKQGATPKPLFTAIDPLGNAQPITVKPALARNTAVKTAASNEPNIMVVFSTGQDLTANDALPTTKLNTIYGIWDSGKGQLTDDRTNSTSTSSTLTEQIMSDTTKDPSQHFIASAANPLISAEIRLTTSNTLDWTKKYGWFSDLKGPYTDSTGSFAEERVVVDVAIRSDIVFFNTANPNSQICGSGGNGWIMGLDYIYGGEPSHTVFDVNNDGVLDDKDNTVSGDIAVGIKRGYTLTAPTFLGDYQYTQGSDKSIFKQKINVKDDLREGRLSWRELISGD